MKVVLYGILRSIAGRKELSSSARRIDSLLEEVSSRFGSKMSEYLYEQDNVESLTVVLNDQVVPRSEKALITLTEGDVVKLLSPIGGG